MQRQSFGSPVAKQKAIAGGGGEEKWRKVAEKESKPQLSSQLVSAGTYRSIHLIPLLTFLCFVVLYLCSHDPSVSDSQSIGASVDGDQVLDTQVVSSSGGRWIAAVAEGSDGADTVLRGNRKLRIL